MNLYSPIVTGYDEADQREKSTRMSRVFVVQNQHRWDPRLEKLVPKFDLTPAQEYGKIEFILGANANPFNPELIVPEMQDKLSEYSDEDFLLLIGNPILIGWATAIAADANDGFVRLLQWSGKDRKYISVQADIFDWPEVH